MPIYEYKCLVCNYQFEQLQKVSDKDLIICPKCSAHKLQRLISNTSFQLKGDGWYVTDYKKNAKGEAKQAEEKKPDKEKADVKERTKASPNQEGDKNASKVKTTTQTDSKT